MLDQYKVETPSGRPLTVKTSRPEGDPGAVIVLGHGSIGDLDHPLLVCVAEEGARQGLAVVRFNFPYREEGRDKPDSEKVLLGAYEAVYRDAAERFGFPMERLVAGGKSLGGRIAATAVAQGLPAGGMMHLGFPLQPPGRPEFSRAGLLQSLAPRPQLFFAGTRDPFCPLDRLNEVLADLQNTTLYVIEGGDHSFNPPGKADPGPNLERIAGLAANWALDTAAGFGKE